MDNINNYHISENSERTLTLFSSFGDSLRQARETMGLTQQSIAKSLCLKLSVIKSIEEGYPDRLGISSTFLYGYIRSYARLVGVDSEEMITSVSDGLNSVRSVQDRKMVKVFYLWKNCKNKIKLSIVLGSFFIFITIILLCIIWSSKYFFFKEKDFNVVSLNSTNFFFNQYGKNSLSFFSENNILDENLNIFNDICYHINYIEYPYCSILYFSATFDTLNNMKCYSLYDDVFFYFFNDANVRNNLHDLNDNTLVMSFLSDCWIEVFDAANQRLYVGTKYFGNILNLKGEVPYKLVIGAPQSVQIKYRGNIVSLEKFMHPYRVARITIPS